MNLRTAAVFLLSLLVVPTAAFAAEAPGAASAYLEAARRFTDTVLEHGRDTYGEEKTPLFVDGLEVSTLKPACWQKQGETWVLCNFASQQPLMRLLDGLTGLVGEPKYRRAAEDAARCALERMQGPNGLLSWGGHLAWDLQRDKSVGQYADTHELKNHQPYYQLMDRVDPQATARLLAAVWAGHLLDWSRLDYNRHASIKKDVRPQWDHPFEENIEVPFPTAGGNLSFCNVTPPLLQAATMLAVLHDSSDAIVWARRLAWRWQQGRDSKTGLCGGQLSYRTQDRAQEALGHVHPKINEAKIVASYHQDSRYHHLPLVQMQAAEELPAAGDAGAKLAEELIGWASDDLKTYARECYDAKAGHFIARMTDGTPLKWKEAKTGYYVPASFAPRPPDGMLFWSYAMAYRITADPSHRQMVDELGARLGVWETGGIDIPVEPMGNSDWRMIYGLLEMHRATGEARYLHVARRVGDNLLKLQAPSGLFPRKGYEYGRTGDEIPLALLHLAAAISGKRDQIPRAIFDSRFFHCEYDGKLEEHQKKRADDRTYDHLVFYGES